MIIPNIWKNKKCSKPPTKYTYDYIHILGISPIIAAACLKTRRRATFCKLRPRKSEFLHDEGFKIFNRGLFDFICFRQLITFQYILRVLPRTNQRFMMDESQPSTELHESPCCHSYSGVSAASMCLPKRHSHICSMSLACLRGILQGSPDGFLFTYDSHFRKPVFLHGKIWTLPCH